MQFWNKVRNDKLEELSMFLEKQKIREEKNPKVLRQIQSLMKIIHL